MHAYSRKRSGRNSLLLRPQSKLVDSSKSRTQDFTFDGDSGQVYRETTVSAISSKDVNWTQISEIENAKFHLGSEADDDAKETLRKAKLYRAYLKTNVEPRSGCRRLYDLALIKVVNNIDSVELSMLDELSPNVLLSIWRQMNRRCLVNFITWKAFSKSLLRTKDQETGKIHPCDSTTFDLFRYEKDIPKPVLPLLDYITPLDCASFDFITFLSISHTVSLPELIQLKRLKNLGVLHIMATQTDTVSHVNDRLVRAWSIAAMSEGAFPILRVLNLWGHPDVTIHSLEHASKLPALGYFHIRQSSSNFGTKKKVRAKAQEYGWECDMSLNHGPEPPNVSDLWEAHNGQLEPRDIQSREWKKWDECRVIRKTSIDPRPKENFDDGRLFSFPEYRDKSEDPNIRQYLGRRYGQLWYARIRSQFILIGQVRSDQDLKEAGADLIMSHDNVADQFFVRGYPIPPIPIVSLTLGSGEDFSSPSFNPHDCPPSLVFTRMSYPTNSEILKTPAPVPTKASPHPKLRANKRMKFDNIFNSLS